MKKLYISCPLEGRKYEDAIKTLKKMKSIAEIIFDQEFEVVNSSKLIEVEGLTKELFVEHVDDLMKADYFIGFNDCWEDWRHCEAELGLARMWGIPWHALKLDDVAPDCIEILRGKREIAMPVCPL